LSFNALLEIVGKDLAGIEGDHKSRAVRFFVLQHLGMLSHPAVRIVEEHYNAMSLQIDLNSPDSQIKDEVAEILKTRRPASHKGHPFKKLAGYHRAFSLHLAGKTYEEIENIMAQDETMSDVREINVSRLMREARKLINGGYRNI
jgi:hypothetical protein